MPSLRGATSLARIRLAVLAALLVAAPAAAEPTPVDRMLRWTHSGEAVAGFWVYWAPQREPAPRLYTDARRVAIPDPTVRALAILDAKPDATSGLCFRMTAADADGHESHFSEEACGFFGVEPPAGLAVE